MSKHTSHVTAAEDRIAWPQLLAYGMGGLIPIALFNIAGQLMGLLGNISLGLSAFWLGTIMIIPRLWDAVSDPVMGHLTDNTRSRWGRRRPYLLVGGIAVAVSFVAMWWVPRGESVAAMFPSESAYNWFQLAYILGGLLVFFTACTVFEIPHGALGMEMSGDYHERTRLFSVKSFLGNLFAMGTPWLLYLAGLPFFKGPDGDVADGMRYVSLLIAGVLIPMSVWWFLMVREPGFQVAKEQPKSAFWTDMRKTTGNRTFLRLVAIIFTLAMGFNFVALFNYYITIFYLFGGSVEDAGKLLGINGTVWAVTGLVAVFPLNWISQRLGKNKTVIIAILLMCAAQLAKIVCYNPQFPYLIVIPTLLLSAGMLMFFTLGASMVGDICDEDDLRTGSRSEGSYYSVYWWFIKMGSAFASFVTGVLLICTSFDEQQNVAVDALRSRLQVVAADAKEWQRATPLATESRLAKFGSELEKATAKLEDLETHFAARRQEHPATAEHTVALADRLRQVQSTVRDWRSRTADLVAAPQELETESSQLLQETVFLKRQSPVTLFRLRLIEIGLPLLLSVVSILLAMRYPLNETRCYEIKQALKERQQEKSVEGR